MQNHHFQPLVKVPMLRKTLNSGLPPKTRQKWGEMRPPTLLCLLSIHTITLSVALWIMLDPVTCSILKAIHRIECAMDSKMSLLVCLAVLLLNFWVVPKLFSALQKNSQSLHSTPKLPTPYFFDVLTILIVVLFALRWDSILSLWIECAKPVFMKCKLFLKFPSYTS